MFSFQISCSAFTGMRAMDIGMDLRKLRAVHTFTEGAYFLSYDVFFILYLPLVKEVNKRVVIDCLGFMAEK